MKDFANKWAEFVTDEETDDLKPLVGVDGY